ncbi:MAG TPA: pyridoxal phosphate-dependent aminotransferase [Usitatibacteraceae bacterium]|nr:pyridoxal phosphate-dependent aminotransferase [Usitatibacteraceae bacterium]
MTGRAGKLDLAARMGHIAPFEVMEIQTVARRLEAEGRDVVHLEIGEPDFATPAPIVEAAKRALDEKPMFYTSALGITPLREAISRFYRERYGVEVAAERIVVTAGSSAALLLAFGVLLDPGDEVLLADPSYPCNRHFVHALGGLPRLVPVDSRTRYQLTPELAREAWTPRTRIAMVASPSNPTGTMVEPGEVAALAALARERGGTLLADEIYHGLTYGHDARTALEAGDDVFVINSFSKYFQMTGWRLGWLVAPVAYVREIEKLAQNVYISASTLAQHAALAAFAPGTIAILESRRRELAARRDYLLPALESLGFRIAVKPEGAFYIYADCSRLAQDSFVFAREVLEKAGVAITPGKDFGFHHPERHIRIAYTQPIARLEQAVARLGDFLAGRA